MLFVIPSDQKLQTGTTDQAKAPNRANSTADSYLSIYTDGGLSPEWDSGGTFLLHEWSIDQDGQLQKLALDFEERSYYGENNTSGHVIVRGWIRIFSSWPMEGTHNNNPGSLEFR